jgi:hypothetical protein
VLSSTVSSNIASVAANVGSAARLRASNSIIGPAAVDVETGDARPTRRSCRVYEAESLGHNFVSDSSCELAHPSDIVGGDARLHPLEDDPKGFVLTPFDGSPVRARIPATACVPALPRPVPAGQLLAPYVDWRDVLARDGVGTRRDHGRPCDIGAVESPPRPAEPPPPVGPTPNTARVVRPGSASVAGAVRRAAPQVRRPTARAAGQTAPASGLPALVRRIDALDAASMRVGELLACIREIPVDQHGDLSHRWGFAYDERDGTGLDTRPALVHHPGSGRPDLRLLRLSRTPRCLSSAPDPEGTGRAAAARVSATREPRPRLRSLARRVARIERRADRFDAWESCLSWLPVTEAGDRFQDLGYLRRAGAAGRTWHDAAIDLDVSEWDDPDYQLLAFVGADDPFGRRECDTEPGEGFEGLDRGAPATAAISRASGGPDEPAEDVEDLTEDVEDLVEPVGEITQFDECMFTVGAASRAGYVYVDQAGRRSLRSALSFDMGARLPQLDLMAFPGEEPPQIECNEDAGGESTEE